MVMRSKEILICVALHTNEILRLFNFCYGHEVERNINLCTIMSDIVSSAVLVDEASDVTMANTGHMAAQPHILEPSNCEAAVYLGG